MFAIIRTKKIKDYGAFSRALQHNLRKKYAVNVDKKKAKNNIIYTNDIKNSEELKAYYDGIGVKEKVNSVKAMEFVLTASPEFFENANSATLEKWKNEQVAFAKEKWGKNLKFLVLHNDEKSPHFHAMVSVEETKLHKYKNQKGEFFKEVTSLNARKYDRDYLTNLQTEYADKNKQFGLHRGLHGSKARHNELKEYQSATKKAIEADYEKNIAKAFDNEFLKKRKLGYIPFDDVKAFMLHHLNNAYRSKKVLKEKQELSKQYYELAKNAEKILAQAKDITELRQEYFDTVKNGRQMKEDNDNLRSEINNLRKRFEPEKVENAEILKSSIDRKIKIR